MALVVTIAGVDRTSIVETDSLRVTQLADSFTFTAELSVFDAASSIAITAGSHKVADEITFVDGATTYFGGFVANQDIEAAEAGSRHLRLQCQGYGILLNEALVEFEDYVATGDKAIIDDLFDTYLAVIDSDTEVAEIDADMDISFTEMTLSEIMDAICQRTQGRWYVDNAKNLHYFADEGNDAGFDLSDEPNDVTSFPYHVGPKKIVDAAAIVNRVRVIGADAFSVTRNDAGGGSSQDTYGIRGAIVTDHSLTTTAELNERGDAVLDKNKDPRITYSVRTFKGGAVAGNEIDFRCDELDYNSIDNGDDPLVIREMNITWEQGRPVYEMTLGSHADISAISRASYTGSTIRKIIVDPSIPIASRGWSHDLVFSATDYRVVAWAGGTITMAGGVGSFSIDAGNTGNMAAVTFIYLDTDASLTVLQTDVTAANAVGKNKILVAVAGPVANEDTNKAVFQVFGGEGTGVLITADNIAANVITANEMAVNSIVAAAISANAVTADKIIAGAVTTAKIDAQAVTAVKLNIGETFFSLADGLLLFEMQKALKISGSNYAISSRGQQAGITGAMHVEQGRWHNRQALIVEEGTVNRIDNPSFELGIAAGWGVTGYNTGANTQSSTWAKKGTYSMKQVAAADRPAMVYDISGDLTAGNAHTITMWVFLASYTAGAPGMNVVFDAANHIVAADATKLNQWQKLELIFTPTASAGALLYVQDNAGNGTWTMYTDCVQLEEKAYPTTYADGTLGDGYTWAGAVHASRSTRAVTSLAFIPQGLIDLVSGSISIWFQMPHDAGIANLSATRGLFRWWDAYNTESFYIQLAADLTNVQVICYAGSAAQLGFSASLAGSKAGDWHNVLVTVASNDANLYLDGVLAATDASYTAPTISNAAAYIGYVNAEFGGAIAEFASFGAVLTADQGAQAYNLQRPLIDMGATTKPGIYILDGEFRIQSSQTGNRIVIDPDEIAGYDSAGVKQFYLQASDGKAVAGGGVVVLDEDGIDVVISTAAADVRAYKFNLAGTTFSGLWAYAADAFSHVVNLQANSIASRSPTVGVYSLAPATTPAYVNLMAKSGAGDFAQIILTADSDAAVKKQINFNAAKFDFSIAAVPFAVTSIDGYIPLYFNGVLRKVAYGTFT